MTLQVGIIGAGLMGTTHARTLNAMVAGAHVAAIADAMPDAGRRLADEAGVETTYTNPHALIEDPSVDAVIVASPGDTHEELVLACLQDGKPVLCEKPLATTVTSARRVLEAEAALGRRLIQVGFMRRFDPGYTEMKARLDAGDIGEPVIAYSTHRNPVVPPYFDSEMIVKDTVVHDVDTVRWLLGQELVRATVIRPRVTSRAPQGTQDPQIVLFETDRGVHVNVEAFVNAGYGYDIRCEIVGENGVVILQPPSGAAARTAGAERTGIPMGFQERFAAAYAGELQAWVAAAADGSASGPSAWDGYAATAVCEAAWTALQSGQPIDVDLIAKPDLYAGAVGLVGKG
jgi:myo-inositol 2-dehydrogenase/D-chiro-inositol 1-dehydrogenase